MNCFELHCNTIWGCSENKASWHVEDVRCQEEWAVLWGKEFDEGRMWKNEWGKKGSISSIWLTKTNLKHCAVNEHRRDSDGFYMFVIKYAGRMWLCQWCWAQPGQSKQAVWWCKGAQLTALNLLFYLQSSKEVFGLLHHKCISETD